jgi:itaconyl-CoA hydratase
MNFFSYRRAGDKLFQERFGLDFEDFVVGQRFRHRPGATVTQQDNADHALDTMNGAMIHYDAHYAAQTAWKQPLVVTGVTQKRVIGMASKTFSRRCAIRGFDEISMLKPVFGGDTLYSESEILEASADAGTDTGLLKVCSRGLKADGTEVARLIYDASIYRRNRGPDADGLALAAEARFASHRELDDGALIEQVGLFFEDLQPGETFIHSPRRSFYWDEAVEQSWRALEIAPRYHDLDWLAKHAGGRLQISEAFVVNAVGPLTTRTFGRVVANLRNYDIRLPNPVYAGDTVEARSTILDAKDSRSRPNEGILTIEMHAHNQRGEEVMSYRRNLLVYRRSAPNPYASSGY